jgi:hypothetical protein
MTSPDPTKNSSTRYPYDPNSTNILNYLHKREVQPFPTPVLPYNYVLDNFNKDSDDDDDDDNDTVTKRLLDQAFEMWFDNAYSATQCFAFMQNHHLRLTTDQCNRLLLEFFETMRKPRHVLNPNTPTMQTIMAKILPLIQCTIHPFTINPFQTKYSSFEFTKYIHKTLRACLGCQSDHIFQRVKAILLDANPLLHPACDENAPIMDDEDRDRSARRFVAYLHQLIQQNTMPTSNPKRRLEVQQWAQSTLAEIQNTMDS